MSDPIQSPAPTPTPTTEPAAPAPAPSEAPAPAPAAPEYEPFTAADITLPEGYTVDTAAMDEFLAVLNTDQDPTATASALVALHAKQMQAAQTALAEQAIADQRAAADQIRNDPEIGGKNFEASQAAFARVLGEFGNEDLLTLIDQTGLGNSIQFAKFLVGLDKVLSEGKPVVGAPTSEPKSLAERLYPNQGKI